MVDGAVGCYYHHIKGVCQTSIAAAPCLMLPWVSIATSVAIRPIVEGIGRNRRSNGTSASFAVAAVAIDKKLGKYGPGPVRQPASFLRCFYLNILSCHLGTIFLSVR